MKKKSAVGTKKKLLIAAGDVFIEKGFRDATVAEICKRAEANISAVNYYFGSKEALYQETWRHSFAESVENYPLDGGIEYDSPPEERLKGQLISLMARIADENNRDFFISQREFLNPTGLLEEVMKSELIPMREKTLSVVREILGPDATEEQIQFSEMCIISMCIHPMLIRKGRQRTQDAEAPSIMDNIDAFSDHVIKFALAGIASIRQEIKTDKNGL